MTIAIPIVTSFDGKGISSAVKEFKNLEKTSEKAQFAMQATKSDNQNKQS
jgi:hypothetical protein